MSNHTPGPWRAWEATPEEHQAEGWIVSGPRGVVAEVEQRGTWGEADARLIAAAPDLLKALEDLHDDNVEIVAAASVVMAASIGVGNKPAALSRWAQVLDEGKGSLTQARAAIAKARGAK